jgi:RimJ/RimL family protein N-acetyltransferase
VFGIVIGEETDRGKGYGTDALNAICDFGFGELRLERIYLDVFADNARGQRSYAKAGFVLEGTQRRAHFTDGDFVDVHRMSLLRGEWLARRGASRPGHTGQGSGGR